MISQSVLIPQIKQPPPTSTKRLLILQTGAGGGHISITQAIKQGFEQLNAPVQLSTANMLPKKFEDLYAIAQKPQFIDFYHLFFKLTDNSYGSEVSSQLNLLIQKDFFKDIINQHQPDAILSNTQFGVQEIPPILKDIFQETGKRIPFFVFIPDPFTPHRLCFSQEVDLTFVPTVRTLQLALKHDLDLRRIVFSGHPIRQEFYKRPADIKQHRANLGLDPDRFTVLFGASGNGSERIAEIIIHLCEQSSQPLQTLMITGKNVQLKKRLEQLNFPDQIRPKIFGHISEAQALADLFHACHLVVAKAGPNAVMEAVAAGKPFIATHFIKGQETGNKNHIIATGIGFYEPKPKRVANLIFKLAQEPAILDLMQANIELEKSKHQQSARIIAEHIVDRLNTVD